MPETINSLARSAHREANGHAEDMLTRRVEHQLAKLPSDVWFGAALASIGVALYLKVSGRRADSLFVGQWAAPILLIGVYMKLVKNDKSEYRRRDL